MPTSQPYPLDLAPGTRDRIARLADKRNRPADSLAREAIDQYLDREEARLSFQEDGSAAWAEYQANGLHLTADEADEWLAKLERGEEVDPPACHG